MREVEAVEQVVNAAFVVNRKLSFDKLAHYFARPETILEAAFKRGFGNDRLFEDEFLFFSQPSWFWAHRQAAKSFEPFFEIQFEKGIDGILI